MELQTSLPPNCRGGGEKKVLTYSYMGMYCPEMARAATSSDAFNAVAESRRREILHFLARGERSVGEIVMGLGFEQSSVSKHLRMLLEVKLVGARRDARYMLYRANCGGHSAAA
jgi:DNA-binding transcriptional ArsR family regulator